MGTLHFFTQTFTVRGYYSVFARKGITMETTSERQRTVEAIKSRLDCPKDFGCMNPDSSDCKKASRVGTLLECLEDDAKGCGHSLPFGNGYFCRCPLNRYLHGLEIEVHS